MSVTILTSFGKRAIFIFLFLGVISILNAQISNTSQIDDWGDNGRHIHQTHLTSLQLGFRQSVDYIKSFLEFPREQNLEIRQGRVNPMGESIVRFYHTINNYKVIGSEIVAHFNDGILVSFNGIVYNPNSTLPLISESEAFENAKAITGGEIFTWQDEQEEALLKIWTSDSNATYFPKGELMYVPKDLNFMNSHSLCFRFEINAIEPLIKKNIFIHALTGKEWAQENLLHDIEVPSIAKTKYRGVRSIKVDSLSSSNFRLREAGRGKGIETYNMRKGTSYAAAVDFTDTDNYWDNFNANFDEVATDAHYGAEVTYDYFYTNFGRNSFDDNGAKIRSYIHYRSNYSNAFWNGYVMTYGDGNGTTWFPLTSVDICGHEVSHAVTTNSAGLIYSYESGALNESFSDIFGNAIEYFADSLIFSWRMGEDITASGNGIRNMANPNNFNHPDTYKGKFWHTAPTDNGGVHINSGVQNYWFYLLATGRSGTNDNGDDFVVDSIGIYKAQQIAYRNLTTYLTPSSNFNEARYYAIQSAADLYGPCSDEVIATTNAWYAVGVGSRYDSSFVISDFEADTLFCFSSDEVNFINRSVNAKSYRWTFGDGKSSTLKSPKNTYGSQGDFTVKLVAEGCFFGVEDSIEKVNYITIDSIRDICKATLPFQGTWTTYTTCKGFIYDHGGESNYDNLTRDTITINFGLSDSVRLRFLEFSYEEGFDSLYLYDGPNVSYPLIGGYTGDSLPNKGAAIPINNGALTLRHFSDQLLHYSGYKAEYIAYRPPLSLDLTEDTTVCFKQDVWLTAYGSGGDAADYSYSWNGIAGSDSLLINPTSDTVIYLQFGDACMEEYLYDSVSIKVLDPLIINAIPDTTLCYLESIELIASAKGGRSADYIFSWLPFGTDTNFWDTSFTLSTPVSVIVSDGCTPEHDTTSFWVNVRDSLSHTPSLLQQLCQGESTNLNLVPQGGLGVYDFTYSDGLNIAKSSSTLWNVSPVGSGSHGYWIAYSDGCTPTQDTAFFAIDVSDSLRLILTNDTALCLGQAILLQAKAFGGDPSGYQFDWGSGVSSFDTFRVNPITTTSYTVRLSDGCSVYEPQKQVTITIRDPLKVTMLGKDTACYGEIVDYQAQVIGGDTANYSYRWNYGAGDLLNFSIPIQFKRQLILVQVSDGCSIAEARDSIIMEVRPQLRINLPKKIELCEQSPATLNALATGGIKSAYTFTWNNGLGEGPTKQVSPLQSTTYIVTLTDNCSEPVIGKTFVEVNPLPVVDFDLTPNPSCVGEPLYFTNQTNVELGSRFLWFFGDDSTSIQKNPSHIYSQPGLYSIKLIVTNEYDCVDSLKKLDELEIVPRPIASFTQTPEKANYYQPDFIFTNTSSFATGYSWEFGDGDISSSIDAFHSYSDTGLYVVQLTAQNDLGCTDTYSKIIQVEDAFKLFIPSAFSPNADNRNDQFSVQSRGVREFNISIFNRWGEILFQSTDITKSWDGTYGGKAVQEGMYYYMLYGVDFNNNSFKEKGNILLLR